MEWTILRVLIGLIWLTLGAFYVLRAEVLGTRPGRGTATRLSARGYRVLGAVFLALAAAQVVVIVND